MRSIESAEKKPKGIDVQKKQGIRKPTNSDDNEHLITVYHFGCKDICQNLSKCRYHSHDVTKSHTGTAKFERSPGEQKAIVLSMLPSGNFKVTDVRDHGAI